MIYIHWEIHRLRIEGEEVVMGEVVGELEAANGTGVLQVFDEACREDLEELFTKEQVAFVGRDISEDGQIESTLARVLPPWQAETLEYVRSHLGVYGYIIVEKD